jgi:hypothetical protein
MRTFTLGHVTSTMDGTPLVYFVSGYARMSVRFTDSGRIISVGIDGRTLHDRKKRNRGRHSRNATLPSKQLHTIRDMVAAIVATQALTGKPQCPSFEIDL